ncbi:hypothetical protein [Labrys sp. 22185]|uniref:hypothetical protein n=1 Tax=Labrys sp. 22185 TaxID=3453888 RepID=UPI003F845ED8
MMLEGVRRSWDDSDHPLSQPDVARHHIDTCIQLIAINASPYTTHLVVMAAQEVLSRMYQDAGRFDEMDMRNRIKPEYVGDYNKLVGQTYNYLKHVGRKIRGRGSEYPWPSEERLMRGDRLRTFLNIARYCKFGEIWTEPMKIFYALYMAYRPNLMMDDFWETSTLTLQQAKEMDITENNFHHKLMAILGMSGEWPYTLFKTQTLGHLMSRDF